MKDGNLSEMVGSPTTHARASGLASQHGFLLALELASADAQESSCRLCVVALDVRPFAIQTTVRDLESLMAKAGRLLLLATGRARALTRIGETKFAMLLPNRDIRRAHVVAYELYSALALYFNSKASTVSPRESPRVSICAGVACEPSDADWSGGDLLDLALWRCERARLGGDIVRSSGSQFAFAGDFAWLSASER
jgi:predicted signal transduction protein with EAL and GGDEF domain